MRATCASTTSRARSSPRAIRSASALAPRAHICELLAAIARMLLGRQDTHRVTLRLVSLWCIGSSPREGGSTGQTPCYSFGRYPDQRRHPGGGCAKDAFRRNGSALSRSQVSSPLYQPAPPSTWIPSATSPARSL